MRVRRMVSEDSAFYLFERVLAILAVRIHREGDLRQIQKTPWSPVLTALHSKNDGPELLELASLVRPKGKPLEMRDHADNEVFESMNRERDDVAVRTLWNHRTESEEAPERFQDVDPVLVLVRLKHRLHHPAGRSHHIRMRSNTHAEAAFGFNKTSHIPGLSGLSC